MDVALAKTMEPKVPMHGLLLSNLDGLTFGVCGDKGDHVEVNRNPCELVGAGTGTLFRGRPGFDSEDREA
jgi:hypothetical protein